MEKHLEVYNSMEEPHLKPQVKETDPSQEKRLNKILI